MCIVWCSVFDVCLWCVLNCVICLMCVCGVWCSVCDVFDVFVCNVWCSVCDLLVCVCV